MNSTDKSKWVEVFNYERLIWLYGLAWAMRAYFPESKEELK